MLEIDRSRWYAAESRGLLKANRVWKTSRQPKLIRVFQLNCFQNVGTSSHHTQGNKTLNKKCPHQHHNYKNAALQEMDLCI